MDTELNLQNILLIRRALKHYQGHLNDQIEKHQESEKDAHSLCDEAQDANNLAYRMDDIYAYKYEQQYGEPRPDILHRPTSHTPL